MKTIKLYLLLLLFMMGSCRNWLDMPGHVFEDLHFVNNSNTSVCFYPYSLSWATVKYGTFYPDTLLPPADTGYFSVDSSLCIVPPMNSCILGTSYEVNRKNIQYRKDLLMFYVFSVDTLEKYSWEDIRKGYKILKRYDLSIDDLDSLNWTITYP
ncbi:MAG: hypothetical protein IKJ66_03545 [Bacteroidaceae bacterium]|nr:hypothetical protein [Bacteroidaceae bacterium]